MSNRKDTKAELDTDPQGRLEELVSPPACKEHGVMKPQKAGTKEQQYCGDWYRCELCTNSVLIPSPEVAAMYAG